MEAQAFDVIIVGAGPAGIATSACLNLRNIPNVVLERDDCCASLWKKRSYDRLGLHLASQFCELPNMPFPDGTPKYVPRRGFIDYVDSYVSRFGVDPRFGRAVELAEFDPEARRWRVVAKKVGPTTTAAAEEEEVYWVEFLVVATGENSQGLVPRVKGFESFRGVSMHSSQYVNGNGLEGKEVVVVGAGNSGMEIAFDLSNWNANTSLSVRSPIHVLSKDIVYVGMIMLKFLPVDVVDKIVLILSKLRFGNISKLGFNKPKQGPFLLKAKTGRSPTIDVGCVDKIKTGEIKLFPTITSVEGNRIRFDNGHIRRFDAVIFATGYQSTVKNWLKDEDNLFDDQGMPRAKFPDHWKGKNGLYCAGFSRRGLFGISIDAQKVANDIVYVLKARNNKPNNYCMSI